MTPKTFAQLITDLTASHIRLSNDLTKLSNKTINLMNLLNNQLETQDSEAQKLLGAKLIRKGNFPDMENRIPKNSKYITIQDLVNLYSDINCNPIALIKRLKALGYIPMESEVIKIKDKSMRAYKVLDRSKMP